ncbi:MAG TPA: hypothetical protein VK858_06440 [Longimicrobiales bacterium]|nr:hypothetical protein [Longimicrobiales bacterium]
MSERTDRHVFLSGLVVDRVVESQADLLAALSAEGLEVHQSTLSRDLRDLGIRKVRGRYQAADPRSEPATSPGSGRASASDGPGGASLVDGAEGTTAPTLPTVHGFTTCGPHLITVRTGTGQAQLLGVLLDGTADAGITGTIAGDDTVLVVTKGRVQQRAALALLADWFGPEKHDAL